MGSQKESLEQRNIFAEKYDEIRRLDGTYCKGETLQADNNILTFYL